ncbi:unnamed protein product [Meloidogyne enterolobii]|uniref:Uncharacterized protein n=1 Tax=Meloidogyne enterolobii TaxID=390850 RepID=A0ACB1ALX2_MELEN
MPGHCDMPVDPNEPRYCVCQQVYFLSVRIRRTSLVGMPLRVGTRFFFLTTPMD